MTKTYLRPRRHARSFHLENLESRQLLAASPMITEFLARNDGGLRDGTGRTSDWIEVFNAGDETADLNGYRLTDDASDRVKWTFPSVALDPGEYLLVFASGQDDPEFVDSEGYLHTNFTLRRGGEYLALISPDGLTISEFGTASEDYPEQLVNVSYGISQKVDVITRESKVHYWVPSSNQVDSEWTSPSFDAASHGFEEADAWLGLETQTSSRVNFVGLFDTEIPQSAHAVYARYSFDVPDPDLVANLQLQLQYDDGFIAYLNGTKIASENAPDSGDSFSTAEERRRDSDVFDPITVDINVNNGLLIDGTNVLAIHGLNNLRDQGDFLLTPTLQAGSKGLTLADGSDARVGYMTTTTPGMPNVGSSEVRDGFVLDTQFSHERGFYNEPFELTITSDTPDAVIHYTLDSSTPTQSHGTPYTEPIFIETTSVVRAIAFQPGTLSTDSITQTYVFPDHVLRQPSDPEGFPPRWGNAGPADYAVDPRVALDESSPHYSPLVRDALFTHPTISIVTDSENLFDTRTGIYSNPQSDGVAWERPASMEFFDPNSDREIQVNAGLRIQGGASRNPNRPKHNMRFLFKGDYGPTKLELPLFETTEVDEFDTFILRGQNGDSWFHPDVNSRDPQYIRDQWLRETQREMGRPTPAQDHAHVYMNGLYWGLYNTIEKPNASYFAEHFGGEKEEYDVIQHQGGTVDGNREVWNDLMRLARGGLETHEAYEELGRFIDIEGMIDYLLINFYAGNTDWDQNNWFGGRHRSEEGRFIFFTWDSERTFLNINENVTNKNVSNQPTEIHQRLKANDEYRLLFADRIQKHFFNNGLLTPEQVDARWMRWADELEVALWAESARWGDAKRPSAPYTPDVQWIEDLNKFREDYFPRRTGIVLGQLRSQGLYPDVAAPRFSQHGGVVAEGTTIQLSADEGTIYFTTNGSDPRLVGGAVAPNALAVSESVPVAVGMTIKSRVLHDGEWSALSEATYRIASSLPLRITELNYHPYELSNIAEGGEVVDRDRFEFIELTNVGSSPIDLDGVQLQRVMLNGRDQGIDFQFASQTLAPGGRVAVVRDLDAFRSRYGDGPRVALGQDGEDGDPSEFGGNLANQGEQITLVDANERIIQQFSYGFSGDWPDRANGKGSSLEVVEPNGDPTMADNWRASIELGGSPAAASQAETGVDVGFSEILLNPVEPANDLLEIQNFTASPVDIGGWYLSDAENDLGRYQIPEATIVPAFGHAVLDGSQIGIDLDGTREGTLQLVEFDARGRPIRFVDRIEYGPSLPGVSLGPSMMDPSVWIPLSEPTFGAVNSGPYVPDVVITEIHVNPVDPDGETGRFKATDFQYVELSNHSSQAVDLAGWQFDGDVEFTFEEATVLAAGESVIVTRFRPTDSGKLGIFRFTSGMPADARLFGRFRTTLSPDEGTIRLLRPIDEDEPDGRPVLVEEVTYQGAAPWPDAQLAGESLHRTIPDSSSNSPTSWIAAVSSPGQFTPTARVPGDVNNDQIFDSLDIVAVLRNAKYLTGQPARWEDGDWNGDGEFDQRDLVFALQQGGF